MKKILFVCSGNTGRSPMAEFVMKKLVEDAGLAEKIFIASAASKPTEGGDLHEGIAAKLREEKISYTKHTARQVTADDYKNFDKTKKITTMFTGLMGVMYIWRHIHFIT